MPTDVIIPARNEERTITAIVETFVMSPGIGTVYVAIDDDTTDNTAPRAQLAGACVVPTASTGKGQVIRVALDLVETDQTILCDADLIGLTAEHVSKLIGETEGERFIVGVADLPLYEIMNSHEIIARPGWADQAISAWPLVSGERNVPTWILRNLDLHGYLTEVQINNACETVGLEMGIVALNGLRSPFKMNPKRIGEMLRDREWGIKHGVLKYPKGNSG